MRRSSQTLRTHRGTGLSQAIDCPSLQQPGGEPYEAVRTCGSQLGTRSDLYGSADVAQDIEAVRAALDVKRFDFYGYSYAAADAQAYAVRYPRRMASVVLDSPFPLVDFDPFDSLGNAHTVHVDEATLIARLLGEWGGYTAQSEVAAAARALRRGDRAPLLRLAAEPLVTFPPDPPEIFSVGLNRRPLLQRPTLPVGPDSVRPAAPKAVRGRAEEPRSAAVRTVLRRRLGNADATRRAST